MRRDRPTAPVIREPGVEEPTLFEVPEPEPGTIDYAFTMFHRANPWVAAHLTEMARELLARGHTRIGIGMLFEVLRWQVALGTVDASSGFKLNNNFRSRYARLLMDRHPWLDGVFETRELKAA